MLKENINILIVGVGGQGTLFAGKIIGRVAEQSGLDVKQSEVHGMAQRGGSVVTYVRLGSHIVSPLIEKGEADLIVSFEQLEALRWIDYLKPDGLVIVNEQKISPVPVLLGSAQYPEDVLQRLRAAGISLVKIQAAEMAQKSGNPKAVNIVLMGQLARYLPIDRAVWQQAINEMSPGSTISANQQAFEAGWSA